MNALDINIDLYDTIIIVFQKEYIINIILSPIHQLNESLNNNTFYMKRDDLLPFSLEETNTKKHYFILIILKKII